MLEELAGRGERLQACDLWERGTQTVFGEGTAGARMMLVGEQPGDREDLAWHPSASVLLRFPEWQSEYEAVLHESDIGKLFK